MAIDDYLTQDWTPSKKHFDEIISVPFTHDDLTNLDYFIEVVGDTLFCIFECTVDKRDWLSDFNFFPKRFNIYPGSDIFVHEGIARQYLGCRTQFLDLGYLDVVKKILIAGYSLGGGLSQLACEDAAYHFPGKIVKSISYEGPRVFTANKSVKDLLRNHQILIKTFWDPVVHLPFKLFGFKDYGRIQYIGYLNKITPLQHLVPQIEVNLFDKYGE